MASRQNSQAKSFRSSAEIRWEHGSVRVGGISATFALPLTARVQSGARSPGVGRRLRAASPAVGDCWILDPTSTAEPVVTPPDFGGLGALITFQGAHATVAVRGEVDAFTAPTLAAILDGIIGEGHTNVVLDLADLAFMGAAGLGVIAMASLRLATNGEVLTVRSAPSQVVRILTITGVDGLVHLDDLPARAALGTEKRPGDESREVESTRQALRPLLHRAQPARRLSVDTALGLVMTLAGASVAGADGVSVTLARDGQMTTVASTNDTVRRMDQHQYDTGEGPCLAAASEGHWFHTPSLADEHRWPTFVPRARAEGIASILSTPLVVAERPVGALNIYSNGDKAFGPHEQELAALFASQASGILADASHDVTDGDLATRLADALVSREVIAQAQGVLMERRQCSSTDASAELHRTARSAGITVRRQSADVVASTSPAIEVP